MKGKVYLIGAGPGDYKLLTLKGMECLKKADVVIYDRLANSEYLKLAPEGAEVIDAGKVSNQHTMPQEEINKLLVKKAKEGKTVARLKGGDPYVFGRGGEEGKYLYERGIKFEVIPGITSAIGGLCYAGIPITQREMASSFHVITGHLKDDTKDRINWEALAKVEGTLVFLMGIANLQKITSKLIKAGKEEDTPAAIISRASCYNQSVVTGRLKDIYEKALKEEAAPPALIVIGEVVKLREKLNFFEQKPLFGRQILVTRSRKQSSELCEKIDALGGNVIECPVIETQKIQPNKRLEEAIDNIASYSYLVLTSQNAVKFFFEVLEEKGFDARKLAHLKIVVIGSSTAKTLREKGIIADLVPEKAAAEELLESLKQVLTPKDNVLLPQGILARKILKEGIAAICEVNAVPIYDTVKPKDESISLTKAELLKLIQEGKIDYITFTSSSTVHYFVERLGRENLEALKAVKLVSIGKITSKTMLSYGLEVYKEAAEASLDGLINCMIET